MAFFVTSAGKELRRTPFLVYRAVVGWLELAMLLCSRFMIPMDSRSYNPSLFMMVLLTALGLQELAPFSYCWT